MTMTDSTVAGNSADLREAFPAVDPGAIPLGARVLVQLRRTKKTVTSAGIILVSETKETEKWQNMVAKVISLGPLAFKKRDTMEPWVEGTWCEVGDYIRVPKWGGDRWEVKVPDSDESAMFVIFNDLDIIGQVTGDPLAIRAFI
jgi:co-chaperonin GroES (HSP10)